MRNLCRVAANRSRGDFPATNNMKLMNHNVLVKETVRLNRSLFWLLLVIIRDFLNGHAAGRKDIPEDSPIYFPDGYE